MSDQVDSNSVGAEPEHRSGQTDSLERDYEHLLDSTGAGVVWLDAAGLIRRCSPLAAGLLELTPADVGKSIAACRPTDAPLMAGLQAVVAGAACHERDVCLGGRDYRERVQPLGDGLVLTYVDITDQRAAEAERTRLKRILDAMPDGVYIVNDALEIEYVNPVIEREFGAVTGRKCHDYFHGLGAQCEWCKHGEVQSGKAVRWQWAGPQGRTYDVHDIPFCNPDGSTSKLEVFRDITDLKAAEARAARSGNYYQSLLQNFPVLVWRSDTRGQCDYFNQTWLDFTGRSLAEEQGEGWAAGVHPDDLAQCLATYRRHFAERQPFAMEYRLRRHDGEYRWLLDIGRPICGLDGEFAGYLGACFDITERLESEERLRLAARVFDESVEGIVVTDVQHRIVEVNRAFTRITGYSADEVRGRTPGLLASGRHDRAFFDAMDASLREHDYWQGEIWNRRKNGEVFPEQLGISAVRDSKGEVSHFLGIFIDITERKANEARIEYMSHHDGLTGLPNRALLRERFAMATAYSLRAGSKSALLHIDIDRFKGVNDSLGHGIGDDLLRSVARRLREAVRDTDTVSRSGGDEFLVVLSDLGDVDDISAVVTKILEAGDRHFVIQQQEISISLSIGVAVCPEDGQDFDTLLKLAETAMYHAKEAGRNTYRYFDPRMNVDAVARLQTATGLRRAVARHEFLLHYQPQIDIASGRVIGVEALIRWLHPEHGLVPPSQFIPVAEDSGLIVPIGEWVLNEACRQAVAWQEAGRTELTMAVNLSAIQFRRGDIEQTVMGALTRSGLDPRYLELELTESLLLSNTEHMLATVHRLKALGLKLSIDDFGTGYSSLAYLKRFAVDRLKIDQSFVRDMATDPEAASIVRAIIQMARSLNLRTVSEGVEDERLLDYLRVLHCDEAQGYYFARPMPAAEFEAWLDARA